MKKAEKIVVKKVFDVSLNPKELVDAEIKQKKEKVSIETE